VGANVHPPPQISIRPVAPVTTALGLLAGALTTGCWLPQLVRSWRTRSTGDLSWLYLVLLGVGVALWSVYGVLRSDLAVILTNVSSLTLLLGLVAIKAMGERTGRGSLRDPHRSTLEE
jgi:MtN3 and saliva related transmembrane protein